MDPKAIASVHEEIALLKQYARLWINEELLLEQDEGGDPTRAAIFERQLIESAVSLGKAIDRYRASKGAKLEEWYRGETKKDG